MGAMAAELWPDAIAKWQAVLGIDPEDRHVRAQLGEAQRQQELASLYARARDLADRRNWRDALADLRHLQRLAPDYKDAAARAAAIELELTAAEDEQSRRQATERDPSRGDAANASSGTRRPAGWLFMGGALGAAAVIALLVLAGVAMVMFVAGQQSSTRPGAGSADSAGPSDEHQFANDRAGGQSTTGAGSRKTDDAIAPSAPVRRESAPSRAERCDWRREDRAGAA